MSVRQRLDTAAGHRAPARDHRRGVEGHLWRVQGESPRCAVAPCRHVVNLRHLLAHHYHRVGSGGDARHRGPGALCRSRRSATAMIPYTLLPPASVGDSHDSAEPAARRALAAGTRGLRHVVRGWHSLMGVGRGGYRGIGEHGALGARNPTALAGRRSAPRGGDPFWSVGPGHRQHASCDRGAAVRGRGVRSGWCTRCGCSSQGTCGRCSASLRRSLGSPSVRTSQRAEAEAHRLGWRSIADGNG